MMKYSTTLVTLSIFLLGSVGVGFSYEVTPVLNGGTIVGHVAFTGVPPTPKRFEVKKTPEVCGEERLLTKVEVKDGALKGAVLVLEGVEKGKPFEARSFKGTPPNDGEFRYGEGAALNLDVRLQHCNFGPFTGVVAVDRPVHFINQDIIKHTLHTYVLKGKNATILKTVHNQNLPAHNEKIHTFTPKKLKHGRVVALTCDRHDFMENWLYVVKTPYFAISDHEGQFTIDRIPPGEYKLIAWHPVLGTQEQDVTIKADGNMAFNIEFAK